MTNLLLQEKKNILITGLPKVGKTTTLLQSIYNIKLKHPEAKINYINLEIDMYYLLNRLNQLNIDLDKLSNVQVMNSRNITQLEDIKACCKADYLFIDNFNLLTYYQNNVFNLSDLIEYIANTNIKLIVSVGLNRDNIIPNSILDILEKIKFDETIILEDYKNISLFK